MSRSVSRLLIALALLSCLETAWILRATQGQRLPGDATWLWLGQIAIDLGAPLLLACCAEILGRLIGLVPRPVFGRLSLAIRALALPLAWALPGVAALSWIPSSLDRGLGFLALLCGALLLLSLPAARWRWLIFWSPIALLALLPLRLPLPETQALTAAHAPAGPPLVLVTLDTLRADHTGAIGGYRREVQTPHFDAFAERGALFRDAISEVPLTLPSHTSMLTGRPAYLDGVVRNGDILPSTARTLPLELAEAGWDTAAFLSSRVLAESTGISRGFAHYDDILTPWDLVLLGLLPETLARAGLLPWKSSQRAGDLTLNRLERWLALPRAGRTFLWVHLYDPHSPYRPPEPFDALYDASSPDAPGNPEEIKRLRREAGRMKLSFVGRDLRRSVAAYAGEVSWTDSLLGRLLETLPAESFILVAGDHGESLTEHGYFLNHGISVHQPSLHVPLALVAPSIVPAGQVVDQPVSLLRVAPTLRQLAGLAPLGATLLEKPDPDEWIVSFAPTQQARVAFAAGQRYLVAWRRGSEKWIVDAGGRAQLFDLESDPDELVDLSEGHPDLDAIRTQGAALAGKIKEADRTAARDLSADTRMQLEALGYLE